MAHFDRTQYLRQKAELFASASDFAEWCISEGLTDSTALRNKAIREYYASLPHKDRLQARMETAQHFCLSLDHTTRILYRNGE